MGLLEAKMLFDDAIAEYMDDKSKRLRANTIAGYESAIRAHLLPMWSGREVEEITHDEVQGWIDGFALAGAAEKAYKTFRQVVRWCIRQRGLRIWDMTQGIELPAKPIRRPHTLTESEANRVIAGIHGQPWEAVVLVQIACGLRRSEACALTWGDIDLRSGEVEVTKGRHIVSGREYIYPTKTRKSTRTVVLPRFAVARLRQLKRESGGKGLLCELRPDAISRRFRSWARRHGIDATMMRLRHTWATLAVRAGVPIEVVSAALGHTSLDMAYERYVSTSTALLREQQKKFDRLILAAAPRSRLVA
jgi:integrase